MPESTTPQVFLSYAHEDLDIVQRLYQDLDARGVNVWFDKVRIAPGKWKTQTQKAIAHSRYFLFCITKSTLAKTTCGTGFVNEELQLAYDIAMAQDDRLFTIVPVKLEQNLTQGDHRLSIFQQYELFNNWDQEVDRLAVYLDGHALGARLKKEERTAEDILIENLMGKADIAFMAQEYKRALHLCELALELNPHLGTAWGGLAVILERSGRTEEALQAIEKALRINPSFIRAWYSKGVFLANFGKMEEALAAYENALRINPEHANSWYNKGIVLKHLNRMDEALEAFEQALRADPNDAGAWYNKAIALQIQYKHDEAHDAFKRAQRLGKHVYTSSSF